MRSLISYFNSGNVFKNQDTYIYDVSKFSDLNSKIIPFFKEYPSKKKYIFFLTIFNFEDFNFFFN